MWSRGRRVNGDIEVAPFHWTPGAADAEAHPRTPPDGGTAPVGAEERAAIEREAFARGFAQGERAGAEAAAQQLELVLRRLSKAIEDLAATRVEIVQRTERQMVQLALAVARRILHREVALDRDLVIAMARVALDRLGDCSQVTVRLHPQDYDATAAARLRIQGSTVAVVADERLPRGGCRVESEFGVLDAGVDAQIEEIERALLGDRPVPDAA